MFVCFLLCVRRLRWSTLFPYTTLFRSVDTPVDSAADIDLGDVTLLPGLMDMELNLLIGGPGGPEGLPSPMHGVRSEEHTSELQSRRDLVCRLLLEKKKYLPCWSTCDRG